MGRTRRVAAPIALAAVAAAAWVLHRPRPAGVAADGGIVMADAGHYDRLSGWLLGGFYSGVADDVAAAAPPGGRVLDVGCGPGHLAARLADRGLHVAAIDLDPAMVERARRRLAARAETAVADVAALPFPDASFDVVVSTLSMHHWADHAAGLAEVARVLRPGGVALVFDLAGMHVPLHGHAEGPAARVAGSALDVVSDTAWRWPGPVSFVRRVEACRRA